MENQSDEFLVGIAIVSVFVILFLLIIFFPVVIIGAGERGVVFNNITGIEKRILEEGVHFRIPLVQSIKSLSIRVQKNDIKAEAASKDLQTVNTDIVINWHLDASKVNWIYQNVGEERSVVDRILSPAVSEVVKASTAKYTAEEIIGKRLLLKQDIDNALTKRLESYYVFLDDVSIVNVDFSPEFNKAIEAKTVAVQSALKAENDLKRIEVEAKQKIVQAEAEAKSIAIKAEALEKNARLVEWEAVSKWNGVLPQYMLGGTIPFINLGK